MRMPATDLHPSRALRIGDHREPRQARFEPTAHLYELLTYTADAIRDEEPLGDTRLFDDTRDCWECWRRTGSGPGPVK